MGSSFESKNFHLSAHLFQSLHNDEDNLRMTSIRRTSYVNIRLKYLCSKRKGT